MTWRAWAVAVMCIVATAASAEGQPGRQGGARGGRRLDPQDRPALPPVRRQLMEQQIRRTFWRAAKQRIGFTDEQMQQLERATQRFDARRRELGQRERVQRVALRSQLLADSAANQSAIASALDQMHEVQRRRLDLQAEEQRELATFMTPLQRAKFMAMQEQVRRRMQELVRARPDSMRDGSIP